MEAAVLHGREGQEFDAVVVETDPKGGGTVQLADPAVRAACDGDLPLGEPVRVRAASRPTSPRRSVRFALA